MFKKDCGFTGDTRVYQVTGRDISFMDLCDNHVVTCSCVLSGKIEPIKLKVFKLDVVEKLIQISLDNNMTIRCGVNQEFMLRQGDHIEANKMEKGLVS